MADFDSAFSFYLGQSGEPVRKKGGAWSDFKRGIGQMVGSAGSTLRDLGAEGIGEAIEDVGTGVVRRNPSEINQFSDILEKPGTTIREAVFENLPQIGASVAGTVGGRVVGGAIGALGGPLGIAVGQQVGGYIGGLLPIGAQTYGGIRQTQREEGIEDKTRALAATIPAAVLERFGVENVAGKLASKATRNTLVREGGESLTRGIGRAALRGALVEGPGTELPQTALERWGGYQDLTGADAANEYGIATVKGAAAGGVMSGALHPFKPRELLPTANPDPTESRPRPSAPTGDGQQLGLFTPEQAPLRGPLAPMDDTQGGVDYTGLDDQIFRVRGMMRNAERAGDQQEFYRAQDLLNRLEEARGEPPRLSIYDDGGGDAGQQGSLFAPEPRATLPEGVPQWSPPEAPVAAPSPAPEAVAQPAQPKKGKQTGPTYPEPWKEDLYSTWKDTFAYTKDKSFAERKKLLSAATPEEAADIVLNHVRDANKDGMSVVFQKLTGRSLDEHLASVRSQKEIELQQSLERIKARAEAEARKIGPGQEITISKVAKALGEDPEQVRTAFGLLTNDGVLLRKDGSKFEYLRPEQRPSPVTTIAPETVAPETPVAQPAQEAVETPAPETVAPEQPVAPPEAPVAQPAQEAGAEPVVRRKKRVVTPVAPAQAYVAPDTPAAPTAPSTPERVSTMARGVEEELSQTDIDPDDLRALGETVETREAIPEEDYIAAGYDDAADNTSDGMQAGDETGKSRTGVADAKTETGKAERRFKRVEELQAAAEEAALEGRLDDADRFRAEADKAENEAIQRVAKEATKLRKQADSARAMLEKAVAAEFKQQPGETTSEWGARIWDRHTAAVRTGNAAAPVIDWASVPEAAQREWISFVKNGNHKLADYVRFYDTTLNNKLRSGKVKGAEISVPFEYVYEHQGFAEAVEILRNRGLGHVVDVVADWRYTGDVTDDGAYVQLRPDGRVKIVLGGGLVAPDASVELQRHILLHELGHVVDVGFRPMGETMYSSDWLFRTAYQQDGSLRPVGYVAKELMYLATNGDARWQLALWYPANAQNPDSPRAAQQMEAELFAQAWAFYHNPHVVDGESVRERLRRDAPFTYKLMEKASEHYQGLRAQVARSVQSSARKQDAANANNVRGQVGRVRQDEGGTPVYQVARSGEAGQEGRLNSKSSAAMKAALERFPAPVRDSGYTITQTIWDAAKKGTFGLALTEDLADMAKKYMPSVANYITASHKREEIKMRHERRVEKILERYEKLGAAERGEGPTSVNRFIHDSTFSGKWGYKIKEDSNVELDPDLERRYQTFTPEAQTLIREVFAYGYDTLQEKKELVRRLVDSEYDAQLQDATAAEKLSIENKRKAALKFYDDLLSISAQRPYAPLKRFGDYVIIGKSDEYLAAEAEAKETNDYKAVRALQKDERHYIVEFAETFGAAQHRANQLKQSYSNTQAFQKEQGTDAIFGGSEMYLAFSKLKKMMVDQFGEGMVDRGAFREMNSMLTSLYLRSLAESSARKTENRRMNIAGADMNMMRAFATQGFADSHFIATASTSDEILSTLQEMRKETRGPDRASAMRYLNEFLRRHAMEYVYETNNVENMLKKATSYWLLLLSPAYYLQQATQTAMLTVPYLGGKFGYGKARTEVAQAYKDMSKMVKGLRVHDRFDFTKVQGINDAERRMLERLVNRGKIDIGLGSELGSWAQGNEGALSRHWNTFDRFVRGANDKLESINRTTAALAAFRLELAKTGNELLAAEYAEKVVHVTHGSYDGFNTPRYMKAVPGARLVFQFKRFQIIQLAMLARLFHNSFGKDVDPQERTAARAGLKYLGAHLTVMTGLMGLPGASVLMYALDKMLSDDDEPWDTEAEIRRAVGDSTMANLLLGGVPAGMGVNVSGKIGMGQVFSILPFTDIDMSSRSGYEKMFVGLSGPFFGGLGPKAFDAVGKISQGEYWKGLELLMPTGFANAAKSFRFTSEGVTNARGDLMLPAEDVSMVDAAFQMVGLPTTKMTDRSAAVRTIMNYETFFRERTASIKKDYVRAARNNDSDKMREIRQQWMDLQDSRAAKGLSRQPLSNLMRAPMEQRKREAATINGVGYTRQNRALVESLVGDDDD